MSSSTRPLRPQRSRLHRIGALAVLTVGTVSGSLYLAAPAGAVTCCGSLEVTYYNTLPPATPYLVAVYARPSRTYNPNDTRIEVRLWGEDTFSDDLLMSPPVTTAHLRWTGGEIDTWFHASGGTLNEDWSDRDELYVGIRVIQRSTGKTLESIETNRVYGWY